MYTLKCESLALKPLLISLHLLSNLLPQLQPLFFFSFYKSILMLAIEPTFLSQLSDFKIESLEYMFFDTFLFHVSKIY